MIYLCELFERFWIYLIRCSRELHCVACGLTIEAVCIFLFTLSVAFQIVKVDLLEVALGHEPLLVSRLPLEAFLNMLRFYFFEVLSQMIITLAQ